MSQVLNEADEAPGDRFPSEGGPAPSDRRATPLEISALSNEPVAPAIGATLTPEGPPGARTMTWQGSAGHADGSFPKGLVLFERYVVDKKLGEGGMGAVWLVHDRMLESPRALKLISSGVAADADAQARFLREARIQDRINHPNAARIYDIQICNDIAFITMEYVPGKSLKDALEPGVPMSLEWTTRILEQLCDVLQKAHDQKIVHRDLKPGNMMLVDGRPPGQEQLKVLDFGIAKMLESDTLGGDLKTTTGHVPGTPRYSSPEQITGGQVDERSDIYSVGLILYEFLTGRRPFSGPISALTYQHTQVPPPSFAEASATVQVPPAVEHVVMKCLAKQPADRPQSPRELIAMFHQAIASATPLQPARPHRPADSLAGRVPRRFWFVLTFLALAFVIGSGLILGSRMGNTRPDGADPRIKKVVERWARQGFLVDPAGGAPGGWPHTLFGPERHGRFHRTPGGAYLPEGYLPSKVRETDGYPRILTRADGTRFIRIVGGSFEMGGLETAPSYNPNKPLGDRPAHTVILSGYYLQETEVTCGQMEDFYQQTGKPPSETWRREYVDLQKKVGEENARTHPAKLCTWHEADAYARFLGAVLPTEAQWEYAARSRGQPNRYVWGNDEPDPEKANIDLAAQLRWDHPTANVKAFPIDKTEQGIFDLTGNLQEWCRDVWAPYGRSTENDPRGPAPRRDPATSYVIRGNSYAGNSDQCGTTRRDDRAVADQEAATLGFRTAIDTPSPPDVDPLP